MWTAIDASLSVPTVRVYCADPSSPYAHAALNTSIQHHGNELTITVPRIATPSRPRRRSLCCSASSDPRHGPSSAGPRAPTRTWHVADHLRPFTGDIDRDP